MFTIPFAHYVLGPSMFRNDLYCVCTKQTHKCIEALHRGMIMDKDAIAEISVHE